MKFLDFFKIVVINIFIIHFRAEKEKQGARGEIEEAKLQCENFLKMKVCI
jgi:hypothetical protein